MANNLYVLAATHKASSWGGDVLNVSQDLLNSLPEKANTFLVKEGWSSGVPFRRPGSDSCESFLDRYGQLEHLKTGGPTQISFVHNHRLLRATKIYLNVYHLWPKWVNGVLSFCGLSGGFHSAIEVCGKEYQFRGCPNYNEGIFETYPAHSLNAKVESRGPGSLTTAEKEIYSEVGRMKKHVMIGLWSGSKVDFDLLMCQMRDQVPRSLFKLTSAIYQNCAKSVTKGLDEDIIPPASGQVFAFRGRPYRVGVAADKHRLKFNPRIMRSFTSAGVVSSRNMSSAVSSSVVSSNTTIDIASSSGTGSTQKMSKPAITPAMHRTQGFKQSPWSIHTDPSGLRQLEMFRRARDRDRDRHITMGSSSSYSSITVTENESSGKQQRHTLMGEITEEVTPVSSQRSDHGMGPRKLSRSPSRITPRQNSASEAPTRLVGYKCLDDVQWLEETEQVANSNRNSGDIPTSSKSTSSSRSKPPSLGISVELRAKPSEELGEEETCTTRQPSSMDREIDVSVLGVQMTHRFTSGVTSSSESATPPMREVETTRTRSRFHSSSGDASSLQASAEPISAMPQVIGNPTFLHSGELTPSDFAESGRIRTRQRAIYSDQTPTSHSPARQELEGARSLQN